MMRRDFGVKEKDAGRGDVAARHERAVFNTDSIFNPMYQHVQWRTCGLRVNADEVSSNISFVTIRAYTTHRYYSAAVA